MVFGNILKKLRQDYNLTQEDLAEKINTSRSNIANYENDKNKPSIEVLEKLSKIFNVSIDYLLGKSDIRGSNEDKNKQFYLCPVYGKISAGQPNWAEECLDGYLPIDPTLMNINSPDECFFLRVNGQSMNKIIKDGAYALIRKTDFVENGEIAVVLVNGFDATLKKFTKQGDVIVLEPISDDPTITTQVYNKDTSIKVIGKYLGKFEINQ